MDENSSCSLLADSLANLALSNQLLSYSQISQIQILVSPDVASSSVTSQLPTPRVSDPFCTPVKQTASSFFPSTPHGKFSPSLSEKKAASNAASVPRSKFRFQAHSGFVCRRFHLTPGTPFENRDSEVEERPPRSARVNDNPRCFCSSKSQLAALQTASVSWGTPRPSTPVSPCLVAGGMCLGVSS